MAKDIPVDQLKAAVNALNTMIDPKIKMITRKKSEIIADFKAKMDVFIEEDTTDQLPEVCVDFYNDFIATEEESETKVEEKAGEKSPKEKTSKAPKEKKDKAPKEKKERKPREGGVSNEQLAANLIEGGASNEDVHAKFTEIYAARGITDADYIRKRVVIYINIANKKLGRVVEKAEKAPKEKKEKAPSKTTPKAEEKAETKAQEKAPKEKTSTKTRKVSGKK